MNPIKTQNQMFNNDVLIFSKKNSNNFSYFLKSTSFKKTTQSINILKLEIFWNFEYPYVGK